MEDTILNLTDYPLTVLVDSSRCLSVKLRLLGDKTNLQASEGRIINMLAALGH